jgi:hypothetical protein
LLIETELEGASFEAPEEVRPGSIYDLPALKSVIQTAKVLPSLQDDGQDILLGVIMQRVDFDCE